VFPPVLTAKGASGPRVSRAPDVRGRVPPPLNKGSPVSTRAAKLSRCPEGGPPLRPLGDRHGRPDRPDHPDLFDSRRRSRSRCSCSCYRRRRRRRRRRQHHLPPTGSPPRWGLTVTRDGTSVSAKRSRGPWALDNSRRIRGGRIINARKGCAWRNGCLNLLEATLLVWRARPSLPARALIYAVNAPTLARLILRYCGLAYCARHNGQYYRLPMQRSNCPPRLHLKRLTSVPEAYYIALPSLVKRNRSFLTMPQCLSFPLPIGHSYYRSTFIFPFNRHRSARAALCPTQISF
jgi:hypothetical protein